MYPTPWRVHGATRSYSLEPVPQGPALGTGALGFPDQMVKPAFWIFPDLFLESIFLGAHDATALHTPGLSNDQGASLEADRGM